MRVNSGSLIIIFTNGLADFNECKAIKIKHQSIQYLLNSKGVGKKANQAFRLKLP
jgi:hypothetical protein